MKQQELNKLIEGYYNASLTTEQELLLKQFVLDNNDPEYDHIRMYFSVMEDMADKDVHLDDNFDKGLLEKIKKPVKSNRIIFYLSGAAAAIVLLFSLWIGMDRNTSIQEYGTIEDPAKAYAETKSMLLEVSENLNKGITPVSKSLIKGGGELDKSNEKMKSLNKLGETGKLLNNIVKVDVYLGNL